MLPYVCWVDDITGFASPYVNGCTKEILFKMYSEVLFLFCAYFSFYHFHSKIHLHGGKFFAALRSYRGYQ